MKIIALALLAFSSLIQADESTIKNNLKKVIPSLSIKSIQATPVKGVYEVAIGGDILYVSEDGKYLFQGHLIDVAARKDLTEAKLSAVRKQTLAALGEGQVISFKADKPKYDVYIFTDIDCGYCRKLHSEIDQYLAEGINVHYLFYPRAGVGSESYKKAVTVWCSEDRQQALTDAKQGKKMDLQSCDNPVEKHMQLGQEFGARGTPMIVTKHGTIFPGYVPAPRLAQALAKEALITQ
jgi:thiol:disulfide interchange protein DsbC